MTSAVDSPSALRSKLHESISDPKYTGVRVSRSQLEGDEDEYDSESASEDDADSPAKNFADGDQQPVTSDEETDNSEDNNNTRLDSDPDEGVSAPAAETDDGRKASGGVNSNVSEKDELSSTLKRAREEERKKGKAVVRQLVNPLSILLTFESLKGYAAGYVRLSP